jgi:hypothetical protein
VGIAAKKEDLDLSRPMMIIQKLTDAPKTVGLNVTAFKQGFKSSQGARTDNRGLVVLELTCIFERL